MKLKAKINKIFIRIFFSGFCAVLLFTISCTHSTEGLDNIKQVCFETQVLPLFQTNCAISGCHSGTEAESDLVYSDYNSIMKSITPNSLKDSRGYQAIINTWGELMPPSPNQPLSVEQRTIIAVWIEQGAVNNTCN